MPYAYPGELPWEKPNASMTFRLYSNGPVVSPFLSGLFYDRGMLQHQQGLGRPDIKDDRKPGHGKPTPEDSLPDSLRIIANTHNVDYSGYDGCNRKDKVR